MDRILPFFILTIFSVVVMLLFPTLHNYQKQDDLVAERVKIETTNLVDSIRTKGYISSEMLNEFERKIDVGNYIFKVDILHEKKMYVPVYEDPNNLNSYTGEYKIHYDNFYTKDILDYVYNTKEDYQLSADDFVKVTVQNKVKTKATILRDFLTFSIYDDTPEIYSEYGGMVLNETR